VRFSLGDIVHLDSPTAGHFKYHIFLGENEFLVSLCLFLNSKPKAPTDVIFDCSAFPTIPPSDTGFSVVSLSILPRFKEEHFKLYQASKRGEISVPVAEKIVEHCPRARALTARERKFVSDQLATFILSKNPIR